MAPRKPKAPPAPEPWLKFYEASHRYKMKPEATFDVPEPKLEWVQGVTTLIKGGTEAGALVRWAPKVVAQWVHDNAEAVIRMYADLADKKIDEKEFVGKLADLPNQVRDAAALRGKDIHALAEDVIQGIPVAVPKEYAKKVNGYARFLDDYDVTPLLTEAAVGSRKHWYAGTLDSVSEFGPAAPPKLAGRRLLLDWKTSNNVYGDTCMQLAAYLKAEGWLDLENPLEPQPMPEGISGIGVVHITDDGTFPYELGDADQAFKEFLHVAHTTKTAKRRKALIPAGYIPAPNEYDDLLAQVESEITV